MDADQEAWRRELIRPLEVLNGIIARMRDAGYEVDLEVMETDKRRFAVRFGKPGGPWVMIDHANVWSELKSD